MSKRYPDCQFEEGGDCAACSLSNYERDCRNNPVNFVAYRRSVLGLTQMGLADLSGMHYKQIQKIEWGQIDPGNMSLRNGLALAKALGVSPDELLEAGKIE